MQGLVLTLNSFNGKFIIFYNFSQPARCAGLREEKEIGDRSSSSEVNDEQ